MSRSAQAPVAHLQRFAGPFSSWWARELRNRLACTVQVFGQHNRRVGNGLLLTECPVFERTYLIIKCRRG